MFASLYSSIGKVKTGFLILYERRNMLIRYVRSHMDKFEKIVNEYKVIDWYKSVKQ